MWRWVSKICCIQSNTTFGFSCFSVNCLHSNPLLVGPLFHLSSYYVNCCCKGCHPASRERGEGRSGCATLMSGSSFHTAFHLSGPGEPQSHHCLGCVDVKAAQPLSKSPAQICRNLWQKTIPVRSLTPDFWILHRNYASRTISSDLVSVEGMSVSNPDESYSESGEDEVDDGDEIIEEQGHFLEVYEQSGCEKPVDLEEVERVFKVVEELFAMDRNMEAVLDQCGVNLSHSLVYHVLSRFSNARKPALRFFNWAGQQGGFFHNSLTYNMMMRILGRTKQFETMRDLLEEMGKKGSVLTIETFEIAIKACAAGREMKKAMQIFTLMEKYKFGAEINNFNFLLDALGRVKLAKEAQMLFDRMRDKFPPDAKTYTVLLSGWCKVKNLIQAGKLWNEMLDEGFKPDLVTHNIMLEGLFMGKMKDEALKLFGLMKRNGPLPNTRSYTIVICALCKLHKMGEALKFFFEMQDHDCPIDAAVYTCLITGYGNVRNLDQAYNLFLEMKERGIPHDCQTYNALIKVMVNLYKPDEAAKLYDEMIQYDLKPTIHTYNMLMKLYFSTRKPKRGFDIWDQMARNGCSPDVNSYTVFIGGLLREGRSQEACTYIERMIDKGMRAPRFDYDKFITNFPRAGIDIFEDLTEKMKQTGRLDVADVFIKCSQKMEKRAKKAKRRHVTPVGLWSSGEFGRFPRRQPRF